MGTITFTIKGFKVVCTNNNITIYDSYKIPNDEIEEFCEELRKETLKRTRFYKRTVDSWKREIYAHNVLYKLHIKPMHTKDTDLTEEEGKYRIAVYNMIYNSRNLIDRIIK